MVAGRGGVFCEEDSQTFYLICTLVLLIQHMRLLLPKVYRSMSLSLQDVEFKDMESLF